LSDVAKHELSDLTDHEFLEHVRTAERSMTPRVLVEIERRGPQILDSDPELRERWAAKTAQFNEVIKSVTDSIKPLSDWVAPLQPIERYSVDLPTLDVKLLGDPSHGVLNAVRDLHTVMEQTIKPLQDTADAQAVRLEQAEHAQKTGQRVAAISIGIALASVMIAVIALVVKNG